MMTDSAATHKTGCALHHRRLHGMCHSSAGRRCCFSVKVFFRAPFSLLTFPILSSNKLASESPDVLLFTRSWFSAAFWSETCAFWLPALSFGSFRCRYCLVRSNAVKRPAPKRIDPSPPIDGVKGCSSGAPPVCLRAARARMLARAHAEHESAPAGRGGPPSSAPLSHQTHGEGHLRRASRRKLGLFGPAGAAQRPG